MALSISFGDGSLGLTFDQKLVVVSTVAGSQAESKGVTPGLRLVDIEGTSVDGKSLDDVFGLLRGRPRPVILAFVEAATTTAPVLPASEVIKDGSATRNVPVPHIPLASAASSSGQEPASAVQRPAETADAPALSAAQPPSAARGKNVFGGFGRALIGSLASVREAASSGLGSLGDRIGAGLALPMVVSPGSAAADPDVAHVELHQHKAAISRSLTEARQRSERLGALASVVDDRVATVTKQAANERQRWNQLDAALSTCLPALSRDCESMRRQAEGLGDRIAALATKFGRITVDSERQRAMAAASAAGESLGHRAEERRITVSRFHERATRASLEAGEGRPIAPLTQLVGQADGDTYGSGEKHSGLSSESTGASSGDDHRANRLNHGSSARNEYAGTAVSIAAKSQIVAAEILVTGEPAAEGSANGSEPARSSRREAVTKTVESSERAATPTDSEQKSVSEVAETSITPLGIRSSSFMEIRERFAQGSPSAVGALTKADTKTIKASSGARRGRVKSLIAKFGKKSRQAATTATNTGKRVHDGMSE